VLRKKRKNRSPYDILYDKCWKLWSLYRRLENADNRGYVECITCMRVKHYKEMDLGHLRHNTLDFDRINTNPQCVFCNRYESGQRDLHYIWSVKKHGQAAIDDLYLRSNTTNKKDNYPFEWLENFAMDMKARIQNLKDMKGL
jgi:hypothetical protein